MSNDPRLALVTAKIFFKGLMLTCRNRDGQFEVGFLNCQDHVPTITIQEETPGRPVAAAYSSIPVDRDIYFQVVNPKRKKIKLRRGGDTAFNKLPDMEGKKLHKQKVRVNTALLMAKLAVTDGEVYTEALTPVEYDLMSWVEPGSSGAKVVTFGKLVDIIGLNVLCKDKTDSGINIIDNTTHTSIQWLPKLPAPRFYRIIINSNCDVIPETQTYPTDFRLYYEYGVITDPKGLKFDFRRVPGSVDPSPQICERVFLGKTDSFGLTVKTLSETTPSPLSKQ